MSVAAFFGFRGPDYYTRKLLQRVKESITAEEDEAMAKAQESVKSSMTKLRNWVYGEDGSTPSTADLNKLAVAWQEEGAVAQLLHHAKVLDFEVRKQFSEITCALARDDVNGFLTTHLRNQPELLEDLVGGYGDHEVALAVGPVLRECLRDPLLHRAFCLGAGAVAGAAGAGAGSAAAGGAGAGSSGPDAGGVDKSPLGPGLCSLMRTHVHTPRFEVASDALSTLREALTCQMAADDAETSRTKVLRDRVQLCKQTVAEMLTAHYDSFFPLFCSLLDSESYFTRLMAIKLLGDLLLDRPHKEIMLKFIADRKNLRKVMSLMRSRQAAMQFEAFHVFKVFVMNPAKPPQITEILMANSDKLVQYLRGLQNDKDDPQFAEEKALLIETITTKLKLPEGYKSVAMAAMEKKRKAEADAAAAAAAAAAGSKPQAGGKAPGVSSSSAASPAPGAVAGAMAGDGRATGEGEGECASAAAAAPPS